MRAGATVVVTDVQRGTSRTATTDESGAYAVPDLQPGTYAIHVEARGFMRVERSNVKIEVATDIRADFTLQLGQASETVTITEQVPLLYTTSATRGGTLNNKEINDLTTEWTRFTRTCGNSGRARCVIPAAASPLAGKSPAVPISLT